MILGRSTVLWMGFITAVIGLLGAVTPGFFPDIPSDQLALFYGGLTILAGSAVSLVAGTSTTPTQDPRLPIGTPVNVGLANAGIVVAEVTT